MAAVTNSLASFFVALLVGGLAIYVSARFVVGVRSYVHAVVTAFIGAVAWALTAWIPLVGPVLALVAWVWVINWRYRGGWGSAIVIGLVAWVAAAVVLFVVNGILGLGVGAFGVPGA